ncbi:hypothetical protein KIN20_019752 [Parelaphostrongylus tenuis]|uniref:Fungal lipase-type domain-containing protein n=1 Tax=Parelaphostrongylus tenuis TaxID=148309 RepID=A0AAD5MLL0_PARTN|nr:hypothetical protein KIN20_019752 [Parelaphostrongylus tenuis]
MHFLLPFICSISSVSPEQSYHNEISANSTLFDLNRALWALDFAAAAYAPDPNPCLKEHNAFMVYRITAPCDYLKDELRAGGSVQRYFFVALKSIWNKLHTIIRKLRSTYPGYQILFTGHSLGGALASLASIIFAHRHPTLENQINLITFGQPRVGNYEYAVAHSRLVPNSWRIVHKYDLVAHLPACAFRFFSHSCTPLLNHSPYHHGTEIWFPMNMTNSSLFQICDGTPQFEDDKCSNGYYLHYGLKDHLRYFEHHVSVYGRNGCVDVPDLDD